MLKSPTDPDTCILCGADLTPQGFWSRLFKPRFPRCEPPTADCYRGLAEKMGFHPSDEEVAEQVARARGWSGR